MVELHGTGKRPMQLRIPLRVFYMGRLITKSLARLQHVLAFSTYRLDNIFHYVLPYSAKF